MANVLPRKGEFVGATSILRTGSGPQGIIYYRLARYFVSWSKANYTYENRVQRQFPHYGQTWYEGRLTDWVGGATYTPQYFSSTWPPTLYGWKYPKPAPAAAKKKTTTKKPTSASGSSGGGGVKKGPKGAVVTNPPLHWVTNGTTKYFHATVSNGRRLGLISVPDQQMQIPGATFSRKWGFRFLYNPTSLGYSQDQSTQDPKQIAASSTRLIIPGTTTFTIELYLNRIADMKKSLQDAKYYSPRWDSRELTQLWSRGTEFDLDFLYRVINGDPVNIRGWRKSANTGLLFKQRVDMRIGDGTFISGTIDHIDVNHVMFTEAMLPTLTKVTLQISQMIPEYK